MRSLRRIVQIRIGALALLVMLFLFYQFGGAIWAPAYLTLMGYRTVSDVLDEYGPAARERLAPAFASAGISYPPHRVALLAFKDSRKLELYAEDDGRWVFVRGYAIQAASGKPGPKLREGDLQVPEGIYAIEGLNANSAFHLSMKVNYPNEFDRAMAKRDGRANLGGDIFIHGASSSVGCLAMGDETIEELFTLAAATGVGNFHVVIAPHDFRAQAPVAPAGSPAWLSDLYARLHAELQAFSRSSALQ